MSISTLILARHGATGLNLMRPFVLQGRSIDPELSELGIKQAEALANAVADLKPQALYSSSMLRAVQTADAIAKTTALTVEKVHEIIECDIGTWEGLTWEQVKERYPAEHAHFSAEPGETPYLGGESFAMCRDRALPVLQKLAVRHADQTWVVMCHNVVNRALLAHWMGIPQKYARPLPQANCSFNVVEFHDGKAQVRTIGSALHLSGLLPPD